MLAGDADRERAVEVLKDAFTEGRLTQGEYEERIDRAYKARTFRDLDELTGDIPRPGPPVFRPPAFPPPVFHPLPQARTNSLAVASLVCAVVGLGMGLSSIAAIVLGHVARRQIRQTGEKGSGMAFAGLALGYVMTAVTVFSLVFSIGMIGSVIFGI